MENIIKLEEGERLRWAYRLRVAFLLEHWHVDARGKRELPTNFRELSWIFCVWFCSTSVADKEALKLFKKHSDIHEQAKRTRRLWYSRRSLVMKIFFLLCRGNFLVERFSLLLWVTFYLITSSFSSFVLIYHTTFHISLMFRSSLLSTRCAIVLQFFIDKLSLISGIELQLRLLLCCLCWRQASFFICSFHGKLSLVAGREKEEETFERFQIISIVLSIDPFKLDTVANVTNFEHFYQLALSICTWSDTDSDWLN